MPKVEAPPMAGVRTLGGDFDDDDDFEVQRGGQLAMVGSMSGSIPLGGHHRPMSSSIDLDDPRRSLGTRRHDVPVKRATFDWSPFFAALVCAVTLVVVGGALYRIFHRPEGWHVAALVPSAFDGKSAVASGFFALLSLAAALAAAGVGLLRAPRRVGLVVAGLGFLFVAMLMIIVTFSALSPEAEAADPPVLGKLVPFALPLAPVGLALWLLRLGFDRWREEGAATKVVSILLACVAAVGSFVAVELLAGALN
jgi:hypothetical protein